MSTEPVPVGVYGGIPHAEYLSWPYPSNSALAGIAKCPARWKHEQDNPPAQEPKEFALGTAVHALVLTPGTFDVQVAVAPDCDRRTKEGKALWAGFQASVGDKSIISQEDYEAAKAMAEAVRSHPTAGKLLKATTQSEISVVWDYYGTICKARLDAVAPEYQTVWDLKTTRDASPDGFGKAVFNLGYYRQAGMYMDAAGNVEPSLNTFAFVAVEKSPPYPVAVYVLDENTILAGDYECGLLLDKWITYVEADSWPGYGDEPINLAMPKWAIGKINEKINATLQEDSNGDI